MNLILVLLLILSCIVSVYLYRFVRLLQQVIFNLWKYAESHYSDRFNLHFNFFDLPLLQSSLHLPVR